MRVVRDQRGFTLVEMLAIVAVIGIVSAMALPMTDSALDAHRFRSDARAMTNLVGLAKMRASASFTRARLRANLTTNNYVLERWDKTGSAWVAEGGIQQLSRNVTFGFASLGAPPPNTQGTIGLSPVCRVGLTALTDAIPATSCVTFNSRGLPVDANGVIFGGHALYVTNGVTVYGMTVTATPRIRLWWSPAATVRWSEQR